MDNSYVSSHNLLKDDNLRPNNLQNLKYILIFASSIGPNFVGAILEIAGCAWSGGVFHAWSQPTDSQAM